MQPNWVDFRSVKEAVSMQMVLGHYAITNLKKHGNELRGDCPIHKGSSGNGSFHVNLAKNAFNCFSCGAHGNILDLVAAIEQLSIRDAGLKLQEWFSLSNSGGRTAGEKATGSELAPEEKRGAAEPGVGERGEQNKPLNFQLKGIDPSHPYLHDRGLTRETVDTFGAGFFSGKGTMTGRVVIPIHNERGELVAYAGRSIDEEGEPKYRLPAGFKKTHVLFNLHRVTAPEAIIVEGFFDCMKVWQSFHPFVVALMGSSLSMQQEELVLRQFKKITLLLDGDEAGRTASQEISGRLIHKLHVRIVDLPDGRQTDECSSEELQNLLG